LSNVALTALLKLLEQITQPATQNATGSSTGKQATQRALQQTTKAARKQTAKSATGCPCRGCNIRTGRPGIGLTWAQLFDRLVSQQTH
jgi:hypothetical protein